MADTTLLSPQTFAQLTAAGLTPNVIVDVAEFYRRNVEVVTGLLSKGFRSVMIGGGGLRSTVFGNAVSPASYAMESLVSETQEPAEISDTVGYDSITVAPFGLAMSDTFDAQMYATDQMLRSTGIQKLIGNADQPVFVKLCQLIAAAIAGISAVAGTTSARTSVSTLISAGATFYQTFTADPRIGAQEPLLMLHTVQVSHINESRRTEPGYISTGANMSDQGVMSHADVPNYLGLGMTLSVSNNITTASGAYQGGLFDRQAMIIGFGDTGRVRPPGDGSLFVTMPNLGLLLQQVTSSRRQRKDTIQLFAHLGAAMGDTTVGRQIRVQGATS